MVLPVVNVIITYHNEGEELLHQAIDSINSQTYEGEIEIIVVDDASRIKPMLPACGRRPVRLVRSEHNIGLPAARNLGLCHSTGEFVAFLDADDIYLPDKINTELSALLQWDRAVMVGGQGYIHRFGKVWLHEPPLVRKYFGEFQTSSACLLPELARLDVCTTYLFHSCGFIARRSALDAVGRFIGSYRWGEEWDLQIRLAQIGRVGYVPQPGYRYIAREGSMTRLQNPLKFESMAEIYRQHRLAVQGLTRAHKRQMRTTESESLLLATQLYLERRDSKSGWRCAWSSMGRKPSFWGAKSIIRSTLHLLLDIMNIPPSSSPCLPRGTGVTWYEGARQ